MKTSMLSRRDFLRVAAGTGAAAALVACVPAPPAAPAAGAEMADDGRQPRS